MKFTKQMLIAVTFFAAITVQTDSFARNVKRAPGVQLAQQVVSVKQESSDADTVVTEERQKLEQAIIDTEKIKTAATLAINAANDRLAKNEISYIQAAQIIGEQNYRIEQAKKQLAEFTGQAIENVQDAQAQESYFSQLTSGVRSAGQGLLEKAGYSSTAQEKAIARSIIDELNNQLKMVDADYTEKMKTVSGQDKAKLSQEYAAIKQAIKDEIKLQQTITEEVMSTNKKLFWSAVGLAGAAVGGALAYQYLGTAPEKDSVRDILTAGLPEDKEFANFEGSSGKLGEAFRPAAKTFLEVNIPTSLGKEEVRETLTRNLPESNEYADFEGSSGPVGEFVRPQVQEFVEVNVPTSLGKEESRKVLTEGLPEDTEYADFEGSSGKVGEFVRPQVQEFVEVNVPISLRKEESRKALTEDLPEDAEYADFTGSSGKVGELVRPQVQELVEVNIPASVKKGLLPEEVSVDYGTGSEQGTEFWNEIQKPSETEEQYRERIDAAKKSMQSPLLSPVQPPAKLPAEEQPTLSSIGQQISEGVQNAWEKTKEFGRGLKERVLSAPLVPSEDLESVELSPEVAAQYQDTLVRPAAETIGGVLGDAARVQQEQEQEEQQIPLNLGTGGQPANPVGGYARRAYDNASKYVKESAAKVFGEPAVMPEEPVIVKTPEQIEQGKRNQEAAQERLKAAQERKKAREAKQPKGWQ